MGKNIVVIDGFQDWDKWYQEHEINIADLNLGFPLYPNQGVVLKGENNKDHGLVKNDKIVKTKHYQPCDIRPKNSEQAIALAILRDDTIPLKILSGVAGSGKTLLACAHAISRFDKGKTSRIVIAKSMTPVGREIGHLKGDMHDKVAPWLGPFYDNFINCGYSPFDIDKMIEDGYLEITPITFLQGRSISNATIVIDEVQNLDLNILKQIITRAAEGTEILLLGDQTQVFERLNRDRSIDVLLEKATTSPLVGTVHIEESVRSAIAQWAVRTL